MTWTKQLETGKELDEDWGFDLYYYGARFMDPVTGRFMTPDPIQGPLNPYSYVANNPINSIDPTGMYVTPPLTYDIIGPHEFGDMSWVNNALNEMTEAEIKLNEWAETKLREKLKAAIEKDGAITIEEAVAWYIWDNGEPLEDLVLPQSSKIRALIASGPCLSIRFYMLPPSGKARCRIKRYRCHL